MAVKTFKQLYELAVTHWGDADATGADLTKMKNLVNRAYAKAIGKYRWRFLRTTRELSLVAGKETYVLPSNFKRLVTSEIPYNATGLSRRKMVRRSIDQIRKWRAESDTTSQPEVFDIIPVDYSPETGSGWQLEVHRKPDNDYTAILYYRQEVPDLSDDADLMIGFTEFSILVQQMILAEIELVEDESIGPQNAMVPELLQNAIDRDNETEVDTLGSYLSHPTTVARHDGTGEFNYSNEW